MGNGDDDAGCNTLQRLVRSSPSRYGEEHNQLVDNVFLQELIRLRQMDLLKKDDIREYELVWWLCIAWDYFAEYRFRFLVELNPTSLLHVEYYSSQLPLHYAAKITLRSFRIVLNYGIRYYPMAKGISILFQKNLRADTPIQAACKKFERKDVIGVVEETLARYSPTTPVNSMDALLLAAIDERIHLDCVYFLLRRQPHVLMRMLPPRLTNNNNKNSSITGDQDSTVDDDG